MPERELSTVDQARQRAYTLRILVYEGKHAEAAELIANSATNLPHLVSLITSGLNAVKDRHGENAHPEQTIQTLRRVLAEIEGTHPL